MKKKCFMCKKVRPIENFAKRPEGVNICIICFRKANDKMGRPLKDGR